MGNVMRDARLSRLIMDGGSAELRSFVTRGFCLMMTSLLSLMSSHESSEMPLPFPTDENTVLNREGRKGEKRPLSLTDR